MKDTIARVMFAGVLVLAGIAVPAAAAVDGVTITPLLRQRTINCLLEVDGTVYGGLDGGGLARWPADAPEQVRIWTADSDELGGNEVTSLAWSGRNLWVGTDGAGLTRIADPAGTPAFRQYASSQVALNVSDVDAVVVGDAERVWYATANSGVGVIANGIAVAHYTAEGDGLISNAVNAVAIADDAVYFGTAVGVCRFAGNTFTPVNDGLTNLVVNDLAVAPDGTLTAGSNGGVYTWDSGTATWTRLGSPGYWVIQVDWIGGGLYVFGIDAQAAGHVGRWDGSAFTDIPLPYATATSLTGEDELWTGGRHRLAGTSPAAGYAWFARLGADDSWDTAVLDGGPVVGNVEGVTFGADGRAWIGSWGGAGISGLRDGQWVNVDSLASAVNDSSGLINFNGNVLAMATDHAGGVWATQFASGGLLRYDPVTGRTDQILTGNSGLSGRRVVNLTVHPDGSLLMVHDSGDAIPAQVLIDPVHWRNPANWVSPSPAVGGLGEGVEAWDVYVERPDVIWFAVKGDGHGLSRWDVNGDAAGPDDPLTWTDLTDDRWDGPVRTFTGDGGPVTMNTLALAAGPAGTFWCGGDKLVLLTPHVTPTTMYITYEDFLLAKQSPEAPGLLGGTINDLALDTAGDLWVVTETGLNRVRERIVDGAYTHAVDTWLDLANYVSGIGYTTLYTSGVLDALPGVYYRKVVADPNSRRVLVSGDRGAALITVGDVGGGSGGSAVAGAYLYPNPWHPDSDGRLAVGNLGATSDDPAEVTIYNVEGQIVYRDPYVAGDDAFWSGINRVGTAVATGVYVVRISWRGGTVMRTLAVVR